MSETATTKRNWLKIGIELEGGWDTDPVRIAKAVLGAKSHHDGSVGGTPAVFHGEIVTRPHDHVAELLADVKALYPQYINETCGFHIHVSFSPLNTSCLAHTQFWKHFQTRWDAWGRKVDAPDQFWRRLHGKPTGLAGRQRVYCEPRFIPATQLQGLDKNNRYTMLNFVAYHKYRTIECRLLPMFKDVEMMSSSVMELLDIYDSYLNEVGFPTISLKSNVKIQDGVVKEVNESSFPSRELITVSESREVDFPVSGPNIAYGYTHAPLAMAYMRPFRETVEEDGGF